MTAKMNSALIVLLLAALCRCQSDRYLQTYPPYDETDPRTPLTFALLHSFGGSFVSSGAVAGVQVALDVINSNPDVLPGYTLHYTLTDTQCSPTISLSALFRQVVFDPNDPNDPVKIGVLGAGCSVATEATARISHFYNLAQISCSASSPELEDREQFKSYFQLLPNQADIAPAYFAVIREFEWRHVALLVQNENLFTVTMDRLKNFLDDIEYDYTERIFETEEGIAGLGDDPFISGARVFVFATFAGNARKLLCEAYARGLHYPRYMFMTYGWFPDLWWEQQDEGLNCTASERNTVLNHTLALLQYDFPEHLNGTAPTDTGITASEYEQLEVAHLQSNLLDLEPLLASPYCHDATWTLVNALKLTIADLKSNTTNLSQLAWEAQAVSTSEPFGLENFTYSNDVIRNTIFGHLEQTNFRGVSGPVLFSTLGLRKVNIRRVFQFRASKESVARLERVNIALVTSDGKEPESYDFEYFPDQNNAITWPRGIPYDGVPNEEVVTVSLAVAVVFFLLAAAGILFALVCIVFNFVYRKRILIRISSHNLNYLIGVGAIILYADIIFSVIPTTNPDAVAALCTLTPWLTAIGYSLCYGTMVVKMWRVYYIFSNRTSTMAKAPKDWMLVLVVGGLIVIDITILLIYTIVEGYRGNLVAVRVPNGENMEDTEGELAFITRYFIYICDSPARDASLGVLYGYKGVLQIITLVFAFSTRKVKVKGLNDAKYILAAIYVSSIVLAVIIVSTYSLKELLNVFAAVFCMGFFIGTTVILGLVFVPKMIGLYKDPEGKKVFATTDPTVDGNAFQQGSADTENLRRRVKELEALVASQQANAASSQEKSASLGSEFRPDVGNS